MALRYKNGQIHYQGQPISLWDSYGLANYDLRSGSFCEDARGRWYLNVTVDVKKPPSSQGKGSIGIDLGLNDFAVMSDGTKIEAQRIYRGAEQKLAVAQRANSKKRIKALHAQIANRRRDFLHKLSTELVQNNGAIFVGDVNACGLGKTTLSKSVYDSGWSTFRTMLRCKSYSAVRQWTCSVCGIGHDRDTNAAKNILARGLALMADLAFCQISVAGEAKAGEAAMNEVVGASTTAGLDMALWMQESSRI
ncbi:RNA-guided endonuclease InsQ/TnpB family protein [Rhodoferax antarcticus]|uniref:RNA-guided endonuclease InsQ/TnpB family protein n=1 Tax=Rhodoferax antarcticus TaxID=81479 RepID=UPI00111510FA|nr:RNA-guided endonuclease TnpB family protein [Rhodoferax antarcticus]